MGEVAKVVEVLNPRSKTGMGKKGEWSQAQLKLDNGKTVYVFNPVAVGDVLESYQNGEYVNWRKAKGDSYGGASPQQQAVKSIDNSISDLQEIKDMLLATYKAVTGEDYVKEVKDTPKADKPPVEAYDVSEEELNQELGF